MRSEQRPEPRGIENCSGSDHPFGCNPAPADDRHGNLGHHVDWIGGYQKDRVRRRQQNGRHDLCEDLGVAGKQVEPALPWPLVAPCRDHDYPRPGEIGRLARADPDRVRKGSCVQNVARLRDRQIRVAIGDVMSSVSGG
jgi:hypothetical protein